MATTKRSNTMGKEKRVLPSSPSNPTVTKKTTISKPTITNPLSKSISPSLKQTPSYLKPKLTLHSQSPKQSITSTTDHASQTQTLNRRRHSIERIPSSSPSSSSSNLLRQKQSPCPPPSSSSQSRLQNAHLSPGPRLRAAPPLRPAAAPSPLSARRASVSVSCKPVTDQKTTKTVARVVKTQPLQNPKLASSASGVVPKRSGVVTSNKKVTGGGRAPASSTKAPKTAAKRVSFEAEKQVEKVEDVFEVENICEIEGDVKFLSDIEFEDEKVISIVEEEMQTKEEIAEQKEEEKREENDQHVKEEHITNVEEIRNNESKPEDQAATEAEEEEEGINVTEENHNENLKGDDINIEEGNNSNNSNNEKAEESITIEKQQEAAAGAAVARKMERNSSLVSNGLIEETACRLQETSRRNKVRALAGAFQTVIDHQTK